MLQHSSELIAEAKHEGFRGQKRSKMKDIKKTGPPLSGKIRWGEGHLLCSIVISKELEACDTGAECGGVNHSEAEGEGRVGLSGDGSQEGLEGKTQAPADLCKQDGWRHVPDGRKCQHG